MKNVILDEALYAEVLRVHTGYDSFCTQLRCSLLKLHENAQIYACVRENGEGVPCKLYIADSAETVSRFRTQADEAEWIEVIGAEVFLCHKDPEGCVVREAVYVGTRVPMISESLCRTMGRLSDAGNSVYVISHEKRYTEAEMAAFQKRSVLDLEAIDSGGVDVIYFDGAERLIEKLLYGGCRELTVFITDRARSRSILRALDRLSRRAPFTNRITAVVTDTYAPRTATAVLVGNAAEMTVSAPAEIFFSVNYADGEGVGVSVGQNTAALAPDRTDHRLRPHTLHYVTSVMSELVLHAISKGEYGAKRLFKVNAKTLLTETIIKED